MFYVENRKAYLNSAQFLSAQSRSKLMTDEERDAIDKVSVHAIICRILVIRVRVNIYFRKWCLSQKAA